MYTAALLKRVGHPLMRWVGEVEEVSVERAEEVHERAVLRASESQMDSCGEGRGSGGHQRTDRLAMEWVATIKGSEQPRWIVPPGAEEKHRKEPLARARRLVEGERRECQEVEEDPEGERPSKWRELRRGRGGQIRFIVGDGDVGEQEGGEESQARDEEGQETSQEADGRMEQEEDGEGVEEGEGAAEDGGWESAAGDRVDEPDSGGGTREGREKDGSKRGTEEDEQEPPERQQRGEDEDGSTKRKRARGVRYGEEQKDQEEPGAVREGVTVYGPHQVRGKWRIYVGTMEKMVKQQDRTRHVMKAAIVQWEDQGEEDGERLPYPVERLQVCPQDREMEIQGQLVGSRSRESWKVRRCRQGGKIRSKSDN